MIRERVDTPPPLFPNMFVANMFLVCLSAATNKVWTQSRCLYEAVRKSGRVEEVQEGGRVFFDDRDVMQIVMQIVDRRNLVALGRYPAGLCVWR